MLEAFKSAEVHRRCSDSALWLESARNAIGQRGAAKTRVRGWWTRRVNKVQVGTAVAPAPDKIRSFSRSS